jgi:glutamate carboxypeptidase
MKGGLVQMVFALRALSDLGIQPVATPLVLVNTDEEVGSGDSAPYIRMLARCAARVLVLEPAHGPEGRLKTGRKGVGRFRVAVHGRAAHAGIEPGAGVSAILELSHQVQRLFALNDPGRGITVNVGTIDGGLRPNVVAPRASALVDARVLTREDAERVERAIMGLTPVQDGVTLEIEGHFGRPPMERTERNRALWRIARRAADQLGLDLDEAVVGGASDGNFASLYAATLDGLGPVGAGAHAADEHVVRARMPERAALLALLLAAPLEPDLEP